MCENLVKNNFTIFRKKIFQMMLTNQMMYVII
nr:MAG TPA: hypothetical protein [Caudoviricetes sp.]